MNDEVKFKLDRIRNVKDEVCHDKDGNLLSNEVENRLRTCDERIGLHGQIWR